MKLAGGDLREYRHKGEEGQEETDCDDPRLRAGECEADKRLNVYTVLFTSDIAPSLRRLAMSMVNGNFPPALQNRHPSTDHQKLSQVITSSTPTAV